MKTIKSIVTHLSMVCLLAILLTGGCKKELADDSTKTKKPDLLLSSEGGPGKKKVLRQSPGLKIEVKGETIKRISPTLKSIDKITSILNEEQSKKSQGGVMTTKSANFTASLAGTYYNCYAELNDPGPYDWYLINWYTGVYTYIGSSTDYINFNVQKPSMYGNYRVWGEGPYGAGFTGYQYMGDPYTGVSISNGILTFADYAVFDALQERIKNAYEVHQTVIDQWDSLTDDQADAAAITAGFDQFLPYKEFESYFGFSSLRAKIQSEVDYWLTQPHDNMDDFPEDNYFPYTAAKQTLMTAGGQIDFTGSEGPVSLFTDWHWTNPSNPGSNSCMFQAKKKGQDPYGSNRQLKKKVVIDSEPGKTLFVGQSKTYKKYLGLWSPALQRQRTKVHGNQYSGNCTLVTTGFDTGYTNSGDKRRYSEEPHFKVGADQTSKSNELHMATVISSVSSTPFTLTYSH